MYTSSLLVDILYGSDHHMQNRSLFVSCIAFASIAPVVTVICSKSGKTDSQSLVLPKWTDWYPCILTDLVLYCDFIFFFSSVLTQQSSTSSD